jgi:diaminobutyrate-2-oxoglutarate transaminase
VEHILNDPHSGIVDPAAVIIEPVQGEGGSIPPPVDYIREIRRITEEHSIPLIFDEIQAGLGRTGEMWSSEHSGSTPEIMTISKGIGGGLPLSAIQYKSELDIWESGAHIGTFRGHVLAMAAGAAGLRFMKENNLPGHSAKLGEIMLRRLKEAEEERLYIGEARGVGLMIGVEFVKDKETKEPWPEMASDVRTECFKRGVIVELGGHYNNVVRFLPPLVLTQELADSGLDAFVDAVTTLEKRQ